LDAFHRKIDPPPNDAAARISPFGEKAKTSRTYRPWPLSSKRIYGRGVWDIPKLPDFADNAWQKSKSDAEIVRAILEGRGGSPEKRRDSLKLPPPSKATGVIHWAVMPSFQDLLTPEQARSMVYAASRQPRKPD
jgi:hypothetical protein